jgi:serine/threonine-protein kinase
MNMADEPREAAAQPAAGMPPAEAISNTTADFTPEKPTTTGPTPPGTITDPELAIEEELAASFAVEAEPAEAGPHSASKARREIVIAGSRLLQQLGSGGMGVVFRALHVSSNRELALKLLSRQRASNPDFVKRFHREARLMTALTHRHIIRCYGAGSSKGWHFLAMEYAGGGNLKTWLDRLGRLPLGDAVHIILCCASALGYAHKQNLVHRDIKPENILLTVTGLTKVGDLGLAKPMDDVSMTQTGMGIGTPVYVSPEQAHDAKHVDARSDVYSLGCMFYHLLAGRPPFGGGNIVEMLLAKKEGKFPPIRSFLPKAPVALDRVLARMLAWEPEDRYPNCELLFADLKKLNVVHNSLSFFIALGTPRSRD